MPETNKAAPVVVFITGYGPFESIKHNPSGTIAKIVGDALRHNPLVTAVHAEPALPVSVKAVNTYFEELEGTIENVIAEHGRDVKILLLSLGVHPDKEGVIRAEVQGFNELSASVPDVDGVVLNHEPIIAADGSIETTLESWFGKHGTPQLSDLESLIGQLNAAAVASTGFKSAVSALPHAVSTDHSRDGTEVVMPAFQSPKWTISRDAGRYLCNCALYRALRLQEKYPSTVYGVFVHVVDPTQGKVEQEGGPIVAYNPTIMTQAEAVKNLVRGLLTMMTS